MKITNHAYVRMQQRAISPLTLELMLQYGSLELQKGGSELLMINKKAQKKLLKDLKHAVEIFSSQSLPTFVIQNESVITSFRRFKKLKTATK